MADKEADIPFYVFLPDVLTLLEPELGKHMDHSFARSCLGPGSNEPAPANFILEKADLFGEKIDPDALRVHDCLPVPPLLFPSFR